MSGHPGGGGYPHQPPGAYPQQPYPPQQQHQQHQQQQQQQQQQPNGMNYQQQQQQLYQQPPPQQQQQQQYQQQYPQQPPQHQQPPNTTQQIMQQPQQQVMHRQQLPQQQSQPHMIQQQQQQPMNSQMHPTQPMPSQMHHQQQQQPGMMIPNQGGNYPPNASILPVGTPHPPNTTGIVGAVGEGAAGGSSSQDSVADGSTGGAGSTTTPAVAGGLKKLKGFFKGHPQGPNLGFTPTSAMAQRHEEAHVSSKRPLFQFQVTKLRTWRTGYVRLLCLYDDHFATFDPDKHQVTNTWKYEMITDYVAVEKDQLLLQVQADKLKFQCHNVERSLVLSALLQCQYELGEGLTGGSSSLPPSSSSPILLVTRPTRHGTQVPSALKVTSFALVEVHPSTKKRIQTYQYKDITAISFTSNDPNGLVLHFQSLKKARLFFIPPSSGGTGAGGGTKGRSDVVSWMRDFYDRIGLVLHMTESCTVEQWREQRKQLGQEAGPLATEWQVTKATHRHDANVVGSTGGWAGGLVPRRLALTGGGYLLEKDATGIVSCRSLTDLYALVRHMPSNGDQLTLEFADGSSRTYSSPSRDSLLVSMLDAAATMGKNPKVHVSDVTRGGYCLASFSSSTSSSTTTASPEKGGLFQPISIPVHCLKRVHAVATAAFSYMNTSNESSTEEGVPLNVVEECRGVAEACREFNASVLPTAEGLPTGEKDKHVLGSIGALWGLVAELLERTLPARNKDDNNSNNPTQKVSSRDRHEAEQSAAPMLQTLHRLSKTVAGYKNTMELATFTDVLPFLLTIEDAFCKFWAFRVLGVLLSGLPGTKRDREIEYVNKSVVFKSGGPRLINGLVSALLASGPAREGHYEVSDLILMVTSDILQSVLCSYHDTTGPEHFQALIQSLANGYLALLSTLKCQTPFVSENAALLLHLLSTHAPSVASAIRESALSSAILLQHFHAAIFSPLEGQRFLSRFLCGLWLAGPMDCDEKKLLKRIVPRGFLPYLQMPLLSRVEEEQLDSLEHDAVEENIPEESKRLAGMIDEVGNPSGAAGTNTARLRSRIALTRATVSKEQQAQTENFRIFFHTLTQDHSLPDLIWNQQTRRELRIGLESEMQYIQRETEARGMDRIAWNHQQFGIDYPSLDNELRVGTVYMRLWLQAGDGFIRTWDEPLRLFELLFRRFLCEIDRNTKVTVMCIQCLERLYAIHGKTIGPFTDVMILIRTMASTRSIETQHRLLGLLATILGVQKDDSDDVVNIPENAEQLLNAESIEQLCQFVAWGHTNGVQVGNLMINVLRQAHSGRAMLTDGTETRPEGGGQIDPSQPSEPAAQDSSCPPVWFVATTGRVPPPADSIRGPFRVSELQKMMESGDLTPFSLVASTLVENYDDDEDKSDHTVAEAHIDTGKWKRVDQVWQLRWQLCTDGSGTGIYSPSEVALRSIRSLTRLVDLHKSLDSRGVPYYPIPIAKRIICGLSRDPSLSNKGDDGIDTSHRDSFLSIVTQSLLCNDHRLVEHTADLLYKLTLYNEEATSKFYLTGVFFFACCYTGSNFKSLVKLLHATHLNQHFRSGFAAAADNSELPIKERSVLGSMLPEGVLYILINYGVERFAEVFVGNFDTPEVIWSFEMRKHLIEMIRQHLGDFPRRLWQRTTTKYEYCPIPGVAYKRLEKEIFCHNYYLNNLCDEVRFPDWPIAEPVEVFRACLEEFKKQMNRDETEEGQALEHACKALQLKPGDGSKELRKAYRLMARKYHPDKNPAGREMFEAIQGAYELLLPIVESGQQIKVFEAGESGEPSQDSSSRNSELNCAEGFDGGLLQMQTMQLLIRTQKLICKRFELEMSKYKYPAYSILLSCLQMPPSSREARSQTDPAASLASCLTTVQRAEFVRDAIELVFRTCLVSPLNAEELVAEGGVAIMESLLDFYVDIAHCMDQTTLSSDNASPAMVSEIISHLIHTIAGIAFYESGRSAIESLSDLSRLCVNWRRCIDGKFLGKKISQGGDSLVKKFALEGIGSMAKSDKLQRLLIGSGIVWPLVNFLLGYDPTLEAVSSGRDMQDDDIGISQAASNTQARLAARALGMLCGALQAPSLVTPQNDELSSAMKKLLTAPVALMLRNKRTGEILRTLNTNVETPARIWNVGMRNELLAFVDRMQSSRPESATQSVDDELRHVSSFGYSALKDELRIGGVYVRVFDSVGADREALREIHNPALFAKHITDFIAGSINSSEDLPSGWVKLPMSVDKAEEAASEEKALGCVSIRDRRFVMALSALRILVRVDGLIDDVLCEGTTSVPSVLLSLLELPQDSEAFEIGCDILTIMSPKQKFADAVALQGALWRLLWVLERADTRDLSGSSDNIKQQSSERQSDMLRKQRGWSLLESLSSSPSIASKLVASTAWLELLGILVGYGGFTKMWIARMGSAKTLSRLLWDPKTGSVAAPLLQRFLPPTLVVVLKEEGPDVMLTRFDGESDTPELIWDGSMRTELRRVIAEQLDCCIKSRQEAGVGDDHFNLLPSVRVQYTKLEDELFIGGVYVSRFLKEPTYNLRDPTTFLEMLLQRWTQELQLYSTDKSGASDKSNNEIAVAGQDVLQLVTNASVYLCKVRSTLCDKLSQWGYMPRCITFLDEILTKELVGTPLLSIIRLLHVAVNRRINIETLVVSGQNDRVNGIVAFTMRAIGSDKLHPDTAFMIEMLKKIYLDALGDLKSVQQVSQKQPTPMNQPPQMQYQYQAPNDLRPYAMAPSPAPGEGPVSRNKVSIGNPMDDPLAMAPQPTQQMTNQGRGQAQPPMSAPYGYSGAVQSPMVYGDPLGAQMPTTQTMGFQSAPYGQQSQNQYQGIQSGSPYARGPAPAQMPVQQGSAQYHPYQSHSYVQQGAQSFTTNNQQRATYQNSPPQQNYSSRSQVASNSAYVDRRPNQQTPLPPSQQRQQPAPQYFQQQGMSPQFNSNPLQQPSAQQPQNVPSNQMQQTLLAQSFGQQQQQTLTQQSLSNPVHQQAGSQQYPSNHVQQPLASPSFQQPSNSMQVQQQPTYQNPQPPGGYGQLPGSSQQQQSRPLQPSMGSPQYQTSNLGTSYGHGLGQNPASMPSNLSQDPGAGQPGPSQYASSAMGGAYPQPTGPPPIGAPNPPPIDNNQTNPTMNQPIMEQGYGTPPPKQAPPTEGSGVDARTKTNPKEAAEKQISSTAGAPGAADGRVALLQSALVCQLPNFLVDEVLENPTLANVQDPAAAKVHTVELLKLLTDDPGYGMKFQMVLDDLPAWKKYKSQDHSLFITGPEQKSDYFLTDGTSGEPKKLLTHG